MTGMDQPSRFFILDYIIFFGTVGLSLGIGIFFACRKIRSDATIVDYFLASRKMTVTPAAMSMVVTYQSSLIVIGGPAEVYSYGLKYAYYVVGSIFAYTFAAFTIVPLLHPLKLTSVYGYFQLRYKDNLVRYTVFVFGLIYYIFYMATVTYGTCVALEVMIGIPQWGTIIIYTIVTAIYTSIGGMEAVIWTDVLQFIIMITGILAIQTKSILEVGGISRMIETASSRLDMSDFSFDPRIRYQFWNTVVGSFFTSLVTCYQQPGVQRINSTPDVRTAKRVYAIAGPLYAIFAFIICSEGVAIYAYYASIGCDPLESGRISSLNGIVPLAVADLFSNIPGLSGMFIASLSSAALSTLSSCLSSLGAMTYEDIIKVNFPDIKESRATLICKLVVFVYGIVAMGFTFLVLVLPGSIIAISTSFMGCLDGPTCGVFLVSMMFKRATSKGVTTGAIIGVLFIFWLNLGNMFTETLSTPPLPPAPTGRCLMKISPFSQNISYINSYYSSLDYNVNGSSFLSDTCFNGSNVSLDAIQTGSRFKGSKCPPFSGSKINLTTNFPLEVSKQQLSPLQNLFSLSFVAYSFYGCAVTVVLAVIFSLLSKPQESVDERCLFSFRRHVVESLFGTVVNQPGKHEDVSVEMEPLRN